MSSLSQAKVLCFLSIFAIFSLCHGTVYYVAQKSSGTGDGKSYANRMSVSTHNSNSFQGGDTIYMVGTLDAEVIPPSSGTPGNRIVYSGGHPQHKGIFARGHLDTWKGSSVRCFYIENRNHITFQDLEMKGGTNAIFSYGGCEYITIIRCKAYDMIHQGITATMGSGNSRNNHFVIGGSPGNGNELYNIGIGTNGGDITTSGFDNFVISYNHLYGTPECARGLISDKAIDGIVMHHSNTGIIEYNEIHGHNDNFWSGPSSSFSGLGEDGIDLKPVTEKVIVRYNHIYDHKRQKGLNLNGINENIYVYGNIISHNNYGGIWVFGRENPKWPGGHRDIFIWSNIIHHNSLYGIIIYTQKYPIENVSIYNNVIANNGTGFNKEGKDSEAFTGLAVTAGTGHIVKNNIFYKNRPNKQDHVQVHSKSSGVLFDYNHYYWPGQSSKTIWDGTLYTSLKVPGQEAHGSEGDPGFVDPENSVAPNFQLKQNSPLRTGGGTPITFKDWEGNSYTVGPDMGPGKYSYFQGNKLPPRVKAAWAESSTLVKIQFTKNLLQAGAENKANYQLPGSSIISAKLSYSSVSLQVSGLSEGTLYKLTIRNQKDLSGNAMKDTTVAFTHKVLRVKVYSTFNTLVFVEFNEPVSKSYAADPKNYSIDNNVTIKSITLKPDQKTVLLMVSTLSKGINYALTLNNIYTSTFPALEIAPDTKVVFQYPSSATGIYQPNKVNGILPFSTAQANVYDSFGRLLLKRNNVSSNVVLMKRNIAGSGRARKFIRLD